MKTHNNQPHKCIPIEEWDDDRLYAISLNPKDDLQFFGRSVDKRIMNSYLTLLHKAYIWKGIEHLKLFIETSSMGRLHWHGYIKVNNLEEFFLVTIPLMKKYGTFEIDHLNDKEKWETYCEKQVGLLNIPLEFSNPFNVYKAIEKHNKYLADKGITIVDRMNKVDGRVMTRDDAKASGLTAHPDGSDSDDL